MQGNVAQSPVLEGLDVNLLCFDSSARQEADSCTVPNLVLLERGVVLELFVAQHGLHDRHVQGRRAGEGGGGRESLSRDDTIRPLQVQIRVKNQIQIFPTFMASAPLSFCASSFLSWRTVQEGSADASKLLPSAQVTLIRMTKMRSDCDRSFALFFR